MARYTATQKWEEICREIKMRHRIYPNLVSAGSMSMKDAEAKIAMLQEIADEYAVLAQRERLL